jgi:hypothetical protein
MNVIPFYLNLKLNDNTNFFNYATKNELNKIFKIFKNNQFHYETI